MNGGNLSRDKQKLLTSKLNELRHLCTENVVTRGILDKVDEIECVIQADEQGDQSELSAQMSLYPLRQPTLSPGINAAMKVLEGYPLKLIPGTMSTLIIGNENDLWLGLKHAFLAASRRSELVMILAVSNTCPKPS